MTLPIEVLPPKNIASDHFQEDFDSFMKLQLSLAILSQKSQGHWFYYFLLECHFCFCIEIGALFAIH